MTIMYSQTQEIPQPILALVDDNGIVQNTIVGHLENAPEGNWVVCPYWIGIGMNINTPEPLRPYNWENKQTALRFLQETDWSVQPDVTDTSRNPHLVNAEEFAIYRSKIRAIAVSPVAGPIDWPVIPQEVWSN